MDSMLTSTGLPQDANGGDLQAGSQPFLANAGIGHRPTLLTVSLVYDERGEASAFHVALIPRAPKPPTPPPPHAVCCDQSSVGRVAKARRGWGVDDGGDEWECLGRRSVRFWGAEGEMNPAKRQAIATPPLPAGAVKKRM